MLPYFVGYIKYIRLCDLKAKNIENAFFKFSHVTAAMNYFGHRVNFKLEIKISVE